MARFSIGSFLLFTLLACCATKSSSAAVVAFSLEDKIKELEMKLEAKVIQLEEKVTQLEAENVRTRLNYLPFQFYCYIVKLYPIFV